MIYLAGKKLEIFIIAGIKRGTWNMVERVGRDSDCGENSEKEVKNEGKRKEIRNNPGNVSSRLFLPLFLPPFFSFFVSSHERSEGDGDVSVAAGKRARDLSREFFPSQLRENLPPPPPPPTFTPSHAHARNLPAILYLFT